MKAKPERRICLSFRNMLVSLLPTPPSEPVMTTVGFAVVDCMPTIQQSMDDSHPSDLRIDLRFLSKYSFMIGCKVSFQCHKAGPAMSHAWSEPSRLSMAVSQLCARQPAQRPDQKVASDPVLRSGLVGRKNDLDGVLVVTVLAGMVGVSLTEISRLNQFPMENLPVSATR